jgi:hypothetical protein
MTLAEIAAERERCPAAPVLELTALKVVTKPHQHDAPE